MIIGVGVEGISDFYFWDKVLHKYFRGAKFQIRNLKTKQKLIRETPSLIDEFKDLGFDACFIILDCDKTPGLQQPCFVKVKELFEKMVQIECHRDQSDRFAYVCISVKKIESWYFADEKAVQNVFGDSSFKVVGKTDDIPVGKLFEKLKSNIEYRSSKKPMIAKKMSAVFNPNRAIRHSDSFRYFWENLKLVLDCG